MPGIMDFVSQKFQPRAINSQSANYTLTLADEQVILTGATARTFTLPGLSTLIGSTYQQKTYLLVNNATAALTIATASAAETINGKSTLILNPGQQTVISGDLQNGLNWVMLYPNPIPAMGEVVITVCSLTNGTTPVNVVNATSMPVAGNIIGILTAAQDITAGNIIVKNAGNVVATIAKATTAGAVVSDTGLANTAVAAGNTLTIESSSAGNARVFIMMETQTLNQ